MTRNPAIIASRQHAIVKRFRSAARGEDRCALLDGWHLLADAKAAGLAIEIIAVTSDALRAAESHVMQSIAPASVITVTTAVMSALSPVRTPTGVVALVERLDRRLDAVLLPAPPLAVVAIDLQDPGNVGALVRASEAGGATGVVLAGTSADPWGWKALRAASGSTFRLPVLSRHDVHDLFDALAAASLAIAAAVPRGGVAMDEADLTGSTALIIGGEGAGLPSAVLERATTRVSIPMAAPVESLNAAVATALLVYEAHRQRRAAEARRHRDA